MQQQFEENLGCSNYCSKGGGVVDEEPVVHKVSLPANRYSWDVEEKEEKMDDQDDRAFESFDSPRSIIPTGKPVPYEISDRRPGDVASVYADASLAKSLLGWKANLGVQEMCDDTWNWQKNNPYGYKVVETAEEVN